MDARRLRYFAAVAEQGSFAQAAAALHVTQPAISMAVRRLEEELGHTLIERHLKPMTLTGFGQAVLRSWQVHALEHQRLIRELRGMADLNEGQVSLILGATFPLRPVVAALESLRRDFPGFRMSITMGTYSGNLQTMIDGEVDMILSQLPARGPDSRFAHEPLLSDRFHAVCRHSHPLASKADVSWEDLLLYPWSAGGPFDAFLAGWSEVFAAHEVTAPVPVLQTTSTVATMAALVEHDYLAMLPVGCIAKELASGFIKVLPVRGLEWAQEKGASWLAARALSPATTAYLQELRLQLQLIDAAEASVSPG